MRLGWTAKFVSRVAAILLLLAFVVSWVSPVMAGVVESGQAAVSGIPITAESPENTDHNTPDAEDDVFDDSESEWPMLSTSQGIHCLPTQALRFAIQNDDVLGTVLETDHRPPRA